MSIFIVTVYESITVTSVSTRESRLLKRRFNLNLPSVVSKIFINMILVLSWKSANEKLKVKGFVPIPYL